ncbi:MAG: FtsX-like permease family protein, partial [Rhodothermales bacterium]
AIFVSFLAMATALLLVKLSLAPFNLLAGKSLVVSTLFQPAAIALLAGMVLLVGGLAGGCPAFVLSHFKPVAVLKGKIGSWQRGERLRQSLVVFQFAISIALIVATCVVYLQLQFMKTQQLGFEKEQVLLLDFNGDNEVRQRLETIKAELARQPGVRSVSASQTVPGRGLPASGGMVRKADGSEEEISVGLYMVDFDFVDLYKMDIVAGRSFSNELSTDSSDAIILSETAVKRLGLASPEDALGLDASFWGNAGQVIGVSRDIHHYALQTSVAPMALRIDRDNLSLFSIRIEAENIASTIAGLQSTWTELVPQRPFAYQFLDEAFDAQYRSEERFGSVFIVFTVLALLIACLGLFGLATFTVLSRTKEIGVRKVLGASTQSLLYLLSKDFTRLVVISILLATPVVYLSMNRWLESFSYRIDIPWWLFVVAGGGALIIAWLTVSTQSLKAAHANPVDALKYE